MSVIPLWRLNARLEYPDEDPWQIESEVAYQASLRSVESFRDLMHGGSRSPAVTKVTFARNLQITVTVERI